MMTPSAGSKRISRPNIARTAIFFLLQALCIALCPAKAEQPAKAEIDGRIHLDVVVTDALGKPVTGLQAEDFGVFDDGRQRQIARFAAFDDVTVKPDPPTRMMIVIDSVNNGFVEMGYMRQGLEGYLRENNGQLGQLTTIAQLVPSGIKILSQPSRDGNALAGIVRGMAATVKPRGLDTLQVSLNALVTVAKKEASEPGRKLLVWLGPGWPTTSPRPAEFNSVDERNQRTYYAVAVEIAKLLHDARMVLYGGYSGGAFYMRDFLKPVRKISEMDARALRLNVLAIKSGGKGELPETNRNRVVTEALDHFAAEANSYYALSFDPPPAQGAGEFHELRVTINRPGLTARTITGYFSQPVKAQTAVAMPVPPVVRESSATAQAAPTLVSVAQLEERVESVKAEADGDAARQIDHLQLTERLSTAKMVSLKNELPGPKAKAALSAVADASVFLELPQSEIQDKTIPNPAEQRRIVSLAVAYLGKTVPRLPNFFARRTTVRFDAQGPKGAKGGSSAPTESPLRLTGEAVATVLYRNGKEVLQPDKNQGTATGKQIGLITRGVFGPVLSTVIVDASRGEMRWSHWETSSSGSMAVFAYRVSEPDSHYVVSYAGPENKQPDPFNLKTAYHGQIGLDPATGTILRLALQADLDSASLLQRADIMVEYGAAEIGGKTYTCPLRSVSISTGRSLDPFGGSELDGTREVMRLNDVVFDQYHVFRSDMRILPE